MRKKESAIKSFVIAMTALLMSAFYVFGPVHNQISEWTHSLSHSVENFSHAIFKENVHHHNAHDFEIHQGESTAHKHGIIELFDSFFDAANHEDSSGEDSIIINIKIDKHLVTYHQYPKFEELVIFHKEIRWLKDISLNQGYLKRQVKPPANLING